MSNNKNKKHLTTIYILIIIALIVSTASILLNFKTNQKDMEWRCSFAECTEYVEISGEEWAKENCEITNQGTICQAVFDNGQQMQIPLEELNLSEITATKCLSYVCLEETPYKITNKTLTEEEYNN